ncbi:CLUMA_CG003097, isoform A [Clunio marinus]|uniref:CLUMA_CG003097, isoform A n=1 Tax=Clunio marinus TaxID=568069 RepID=A0A1J1HP81_9DIPT|nr:CLUMA_CG003097, isoform A [Clunio marinus]
MEKFLYPQLESISHESCGAVCWFHSLKLVQRKLLQYEKNADSWRTYLLTRNLTLSLEIGDNWLEQVHTRSASFPHSSVIRKSENDSY